MRVFDYKKIREIKCDNELVLLVSQIMEYNTRLEELVIKPDDDYSYLKTQSLVNSIQSSNKIEGIITTRSRLVKILNSNENIKTKDDKEIAGYSYVLKNINNSFKDIGLTSNIILQLHRDLYKFTKKNFGGRYKSIPNHIEEIKDGERKVRFTPLQPYEVKEAMEELCTEFIKELNSYEIHPLILIPIFILDFLCIHPFNDGNGRISRLLNSLLLYKNNFMISQYISVDKQIESNKTLYYESLRLSSAGWHENKNDYMPFIKFSLKMILGAYREFEYNIDYRNIKNKSSYKLVKEAAFNQIGSFDKKRMMEVVPSLSRSSIEKALNKLEQEKVIIKKGVGRATKYVLNGDENRQ
ncbi:Fic family protein [Mycoplasma sp. Mirounga ES2805-ORL]|uniref:Fic family protein n=1 Tax=Mycoplasma sp. Mirounga ES2805-ORL TaxID=754514 RepID=UPI00197B8E8A|nr:Fic family protein [Mycoplasma sp. Mirounga ES2805-ORL]QSF13466.1 Fic family protein [Mycoplasma sp. Mirounga ES2805-ORL]